MRFWITIGFLIPLATAFSQQLPANNLDPTRLAEELFAQQDLDLNYEDLYESVLQYLATPLDVNKATAEELRMLCVLQESQITALIEHRNKSGPLLSIYELQSIDGFDPDIIRRLAPFVRVGAGQHAGRFLRTMLNEADNYLLLRYERMFETKAGYLAQDTAHRFIGKPDEMFVRFRINKPRDLSLGFTVEKDPGESKITDYYSFHIQKSGGKRLVNLIAGDFQAFFGQGLIMGGGFGMGKGSETILTMRRNTLGFIPWTSSTEAGFFRGIGSTVAITKKLLIHGFASSTSRDALVHQNAVSGEKSASLQITGLHRNYIELAHQRILSENNAALVLEYKGRRLQAGITSMQTRWSVPLAKSEDIYNRREPSGAMCANAGAFVNYTIRNFNVFGEAAKTLGWGTGLVAGTLVSVNRKTDFAIVARRYESDFWSPYGSAISENSIARNESGFYWGWKVQASKRFMIAGYTDLFHFPWLQYRSYVRSSNGHDALLRLTWKPRKEVGVILQAREERKSRNISQDLPVYLTTMGIKRNYCLSFDFSSGMFVLRTRIQGSTLRFDSRSSGIAILQDVGLEFRRCSLFLRHALFATDDFDNRQYTYEPDVLMAYSFPAYFGAGVRTTAMFRLNLGRHADIWIRWARTRLEDRASSGSGVDAVDGPGRNDMKIQLRLKL